MQLQEDKFGYKIQMFVPAKGATLDSPYTPTEDEIIVLGDDVTITLDSVGVPYTVGTVIGLRKGVKYTLSASISVHKM